MRWLGFAASVVLLQVGCGSLSDEDERLARREVEVLTAEPGGAADAAERRLIARGRGAIVHLETGLYTADPNARRRVIRTLVAIGHADAWPILEHLVRRDPDAEVRAAAVAGLAAVGHLTARRDGPSDVPRPTPPASGGDPGAIPARTDAPAP